MPTYKTFGFNNDTKRFLNAVEATGGSISFRTAQAVNNFVDSCDNVGIWDSITECGVFVGDNWNAALTKLKWSPTAGPYLSNSGFDPNVAYSQTGGWQGNGTGFLNTNLQHRYTSPAESAHLAVYARTSGDPGVGKGLLGIMGTTPRYHLFIASDGASLQFGLNQNTIDGFTVSGSTGLLLSSRTSSNTDNYYVNNGQVYTSPVTSVSSGFLTAPILMFARSTPGEATSRALSFYSVGAGLTPPQVSGYYSAVQRLQTDLGRAV